ncbi:hypothetical protein ACFLS9_01430 [Bacteroidota bacterium]
MRERSIILLLFSISALVRYGLADLSEWSIDEASNLWLASRITEGEMEQLGLLSSIGIRNLVGAPLMAVPFTFLPDLLSVSRGLAFLHLVPLAILGFFIGNRKGGKVFASFILIFFPSMIFASFNLWNQYLIIPISVTNLILLLWLLEGQGGAVLRASTASAIVALSLVQPAVHLICFVDLIVQLVLLGAVLVIRPYPFSRVTAMVWTLVILALGTAIYYPWIADTILRMQGRWLSSFRVIVLLVVAATTGIILVRFKGFKSFLEKILTYIGQSRLFSWVIPVFLFFALFSCAVTSLWGIHIGRRLLEAIDSFGLMILAVQVILSLLLLPPLFVMLRECWRGLSCRDLIQKYYPNRSSAATLLLFHAIFLFGGRFILSPTIFSPFGRSDLLLPLVPALLAPCILLVLETGYKKISIMSITGVTVTIVILCTFAIFGPTEVFWSKYPHFVPPSEMCETVDWIAEQHKENNSRREIDLGYDLIHGLEWLPGITRFPEFRWYSIGRPYDWLLLRRHGIVNAREGTVDRTGGTGFQIGFRCEHDSLSTMRIIHQTAHLEIRQNQESQ